MRHRTTLYPEEGRRDGEWRHLWEFYSAYELTPLVSEGQIRQWNEAACGRYCQIHGLIEMSSRDVFEERHGHRYLVLYASAWGKTPCDAPQPSDSFSRSRRAA